MPRSRRPQVIVFPVKLWLIPGRDDDLIDYLQSLPTGQRAAAIMRAMRGGLSNQSAIPGEDDEINNLLDSLGEM